ncbi:MAG: type I-E CRISPR-associated protein Cas7/Cse4/CasC [Methylococcales bacterium]|nr:type I-E CRISPR-associated protein Cas7/Cse4/CasC [Methylococcales bacterium]
MYNPLRNTRIEFHILQSFPVTCLNRDDVGAPKTAMVGGSTRARVSSQCWKRQVRLEMHELGVRHGSRTKHISRLIADACMAKGATPERAKACGDKFEQVFIKKKEEKKSKKGKEYQDAEMVEGETDAAAEKSDTLLFLSPKEVNIVAEAFLAKGFEPELVITQKDAKKQAKEVAGLIGDINVAVDALDIALFGRMVAQASELNVEAASSFAHAISTHKVSNEVEFFTALDDLQDDPGAAHMGSLEFNSATYYRYISLDLGQLYQTLAGQNLPESVAVFTKALFIAVPAARQTTLSGASPWEFAKILVRNGQRLQAPFETAVKAEEGGFLRPSISHLQTYLSKKEKLCGSLFGKIAEYNFGEDENFSIDDLVTALQKHAKISAHA